MTEGPKDEVEVKEMVSDDDLDNVEGGSVLDALGDGGVLGWGGNGGNGGVRIERC